MQTKKQNFFSLQSGIWKKDGKLKHTRQHSK